MLADAQPPRPKSTNNSRLTTNTRVWLSRFQAILSSHNNANISALLLLARYANLHALLLLCVCYRRIWRGCSWCTRALLWSYVRMNKMKTKGDGKIMLDMYKCWEFPRMRQLTFLIRL